MPRPRERWIWGRYLLVLYYLVVLVVVWQLIARRYVSSRNKLDATNPSKFPIEIQGIASGGKALDGDWKMQANFTVIDTFPSSSKEAGKGQSGKNSRSWLNQADKSSSGVEVRGRIQVHLTALCPQDRFSKELCLSVVPVVEAGFGPGLENIQKFLYTAYPRPGTDDKQDLKHYFAASIPKVDQIVVNIRQFSAEEKETMIGYVAHPRPGKPRDMNLDLDYITERPLGLFRFQVHSLVQHELVHCYQHFAPRPDSRLPPTGLIEGIADFVALKAGMLDPGWKPQRPISSKLRAKRWDVGYAETAYFLEWLEDVRIGKGAVGKLNDGLLRYGYYFEGGGAYDKTGNHFWKQLFGRTVDELWEEYGEWVDSTNPWGLSWAVSFLQWILPSRITTIGLDGRELEINVFIPAVLLLFVGMPILVYAVVESLFAFYDGMNSDRGPDNNHADQGDPDQGARGQPEEHEPSSNNEERGDHEQPRDSIPQRDEPAQSGWFHWKMPSLFRSSAPRCKLTIFDVEGVEWEVKTIVQSRTFYGKLQYRVRWVGENENDAAWHYAQTFKHGPEMLQDYHDKNPEAAGPSVRLEEWLEAARASTTLEDHPYDNKPVRKPGGSTQSDPPASQSSVKHRSHRSRGRQHKSRH